MTEDTSRPSWEAIECATTAGRIAFKQGIDDPKNDETYTNICAVVDTTGHPYLLTAWLDGWEKQAQQPTDTAMATAKEFGAAHFHASKADPNYGDFNPTFLAMMRDRGKHYRLMLMSAWISGWTDAFLKRSPAPQPRNTAAVR